MSLMKLSLLPLLLPLTASECPSVEDLPVLYDNRTTAAMAVILHSRCSWQF